MLNFILYNISALLPCYFCVYCCHKLNNKKINYKSWRIYFSVVLMALLGTFIAFSLPIVLKIILMVLVVTNINYFMFFKNLKISLLTAFFSELIAFLLELIMAVPLSLFSQDLLAFSRIGVGTIIVNLVVMILCFALLKLPICPKIYNYVLIRIDHIKSEVLFAYSIIIVVIINVLAVFCYAVFDFRGILILSSLLIICYIFIGFKMLEEVNNSKKISSKYNTSLKNLKELEIIIDQYKMEMHENRNELLRIGVMVKRKKKDIDKYIDKIVKNKDKTTILKIDSIDRIPEGGLQATIYSKIGLMEKNKINYDVQLSKDLRMYDFDSIDNDTMLDVCRIVGVYLDNAIESAALTKEKRIIIEIYIDEDLYIEITNSYEPDGSIDMDKLGTCQYTTKGEGHGYGLLLVEKLSSENPKLLKRHKTLKNAFRQTIIIKNKV